MAVSQPGLRTLFSGTLNFFVLLLTLASGTAQLAVVRAGLARAALVALFLTGLLYFVVRVWQFYFVQKVRELRRQLAAEAEKLTLAQAGHQRYPDAIERISEREKPLFSETLELTVWIGATDDADRVREKRITTPAPLVTHRTMRPIVPTDRDRIVRAEEIGFEPGREGGGITWLPLREQTNKLKVWLIFDPALTTETEWVVQYLPAGLWAPLRQRGWDQLVWDDRLPAANGTPSAFTSFTVRFKFGPSDKPPTVTEREGYGEPTETARDPVDGSWEVLWRDRKPAGHRYVWDLTQPLRRR